MRGAALTAEDLRLHMDLGIAPEILEQAQVCRVTDTEARALGFKSKGDLSGVLYPYVVNGHAATYRVRRDRPEIENGRPRNKYLLPYGCNPHAYLSACNPDDYADPAVPMVWMEAEKSAQMIASVAKRTGRRLAPVALGGCWGWRGRVGKTGTADGARTDETGMLSDLRNVITPDRIVIVWLDANVTTNPMVSDAEEALTRALTALGGVVCLARIPDRPNVNGPDDYRRATSDEAVLAVLDAATPAVVRCETVADHLAYARLDALIVGEAPIDLESRLHRLGDSVSGRDAVRVQLVRKDAIAALKAAKIAGAAALVDAALSLGREDVDAPATLLEDDAPAPMAVDGAALLDDVVTVIQRYVVLPSDESAHAIALWVLLAWCESGVSILPLLLFASPTKRCGKSKTMTVLGALLRKALSVSGISPAALFRSIEKWHPALLIDEADTLLPGNEELRGLINAGHTRHAATIIRCVGEDQEPTPFSVWCPKVLAMIGRPHDTIIDRSILVEMRRKTPADKVSRLREDLIRGDLAALRQQCRRWADDHAAALKGADPDLPPLHDRAADNWRAMIAIAALAGGEWPARARKAASALSGAEDDDDQPIGVLLLGDIGDVWVNGAPKGGGNWMASAVLLEKLHAVEDRPWRSFGRTEQPLTGAKLARLLRPFGIAIHKVRDDKKTVNAYHWHQVQEALTRYAPPVKAERRNTVTRSSEIVHSKAEPDSQGCSASKTRKPQQPVAVFRRSASTPPTTQDGGVSEPEVVNAKYF